MTTGHLIYDGPSTIDGSPIAAVLTYRSTNMKTGPIPQLWILPRDTAPHEAVKTGKDVGVCGGCPHRPSAHRPSSGGGSCYVTTFRGPLAVWRTFQRGGYPPATPSKVKHRLAQLAPRAIRLGAWGEPVAVPLFALQPLVDAARAVDAAVLGYTHRWAAPSSAGYQGFLMASVDSPAEGVRARAAGWRTFRTMLAGEQLADGERVCPAESDGATCNSCRACDGGRAATFAGSVVIHAHGAASKLAAYRRLRTARGDM